MGSKEEPNDKVHTKIKADWLKKNLITIVPVSFDRDLAWRCTAQCHPAPGTKSADAPAPGAGMPSRRSPYAGTSIKVILSCGSCAITGESRSTPGRVQPTKCKIEDRVHLVPGEYLRQRVGAGNEVHVNVVAALDAQIAERVRSVGRPTSIDVNAADREPRIGRSSNNGHQIAVLRR